MQIRHHLMHVKTWSIIMQMLGQVDITVRRPAHTICHLILFNDEPRELCINIGHRFCPERALGDNSAAIHQADRPKQVRFPVAHKLE